MGRNPEQALSNVGRRGFRAGGVRLRIWGHFNVQGHGSVLVRGVLSHCLLLQGNFGDIGACRKSLV